MNQQRGRGPFAGRGGNLLGAAGAYISRREDAGRAGLQNARLTRLEAGRSRAAMHQVVPGDDEFFYLASACRAARSASNFSRQSPQRSK